LTEKRHFEALTRPGTWIGGSSQRMTANCSVLHDFSNFYFLEKLEKIMAPRTISTSADKDKTRKALDVEWELKHRKLVAEMTADPSPMDEEAILAEAVSRTDA